MAVRRQRSSEHKGILLVNKYLDSWRLAFPLRTIGLYPCIFLHKHPSRQIRVAVLACDLTVRQIPVHTNKAHGMYCACICIVYLSEKHFHEKQLTKAEILRDIHGPCVDVNR